MVLVYDFEEPEPSLSLFCFRLLDELYFLSLSLYVLSSLMYDSMIHNFAVIGDDQIIWSYCIDEL